VTDQEVDAALLLLIRLTPEQRLAVLENLPEWQRLTRLNDMRSVIQQEVVDAIVAIAVSARESAMPSGNPLADLTNAARRYAGKIRVAKVAVKPTKVEPLT
jgi:hypothetical protein